MPITQYTPNKYFIFQKKKKGDVQVPCDTAHNLHLAKTFFGRGCGAVVLATSKQLLWCARHQCPLLERLKLRLQHPPELP